MPGRRNFLKSAAGLLAATALPWKMEGLQDFKAADQQVEPLPEWQPGVLEIHHIDTGRGNASLILGPDGTSFLIDAGEAHSAEETMAPARPDTSRRAGEWIARYVRRQLNRTRQNDLDLMLLTHLHGDHVGEVSPSSPQSQQGAYRLTGAADIAEAINVRELIDRGSPDYAYPSRQSDASALNYISLAKCMQSRGTKVQRAKAGSVNQLALRHDTARYPGFNVRILSVNGDVAAGPDAEAKAMFPAVAGLSHAELPTENMCCVSFRLQYGGFRYYSGGDLTCDTSYGRYPWHDIESPVATAAGPVSVAVANHHGYFDACAPLFVRTLRPRVWVMPAWHVSHPAINVLANLFSTELYPDERSVFAVGMTPEALLTTERFSNKLSSSDGHVVVRVPAGGQEFTVHVVNARNELGMVAKTFGPFAA